MRVEFFKPNITDREREAVLEVLQGNFITTGARCLELEERLADYFGVSRAVTLSSCTACLHLSLIALGIGRGDRVAIPSFTFASTANVVLYVGAEPILIDSDPDTGLMNLDILEEKLREESISAVIPVHLYGQMVDMYRLKELSDKYGFKIIEDAAHAFEAVRDNIKPGHLSDVACFSFYATKNLTSGEGGALITNDESLASRIKTLRLHGMNKTAIDRYRRGPGDWDVVELGFKYNLTDFQAAMLIPQLERVENNWRRRYEIYNLYKKELKGISEISIPKQVFLKGNRGWVTRSALHLFVIWLRNRTMRDKLMEFLKKRGIGVTINWPRAVHMYTYYQKLFGYKDKDFPVSMRLAQTSLSLPFYPQLRDEEARYVTQSIREFFNSI